MILIVFPIGETKVFGLPLKAEAGVTTLPIISHLLAAFQFRCSLLISAVALRRQINLNLVVP